MIDALKELVGIIKELPDMAIWVLAGFLFYKTFIVGSIYGLARLFITKSHDILKTQRLKPKEKIIEMTVDGEIITHDTTPEILKDFLRSLKNISDDGVTAKRAGGQNSRYIHTSDLKYAMLALDEKLAKDGILKGEAAIKAFVDMASKKK